MGVILTHDLMQPQYTDEQLDILALRAFLSAYKLIQDYYTQAQRKKVIMPYLNEVRAMFGDDSVGFRAFLILARAAGIPADIESMKRAAGMYITGERK